jgi:hypothetical protein
MQRESPNAQLLLRRGVAPKSDLIGIDAERREKMLRDFATALPDSRRAAGVRFALARGAGVS